MFADGLIVVEAAIVGGLTSMFDKFMLVVHRRGAANHLPTRIGCGYHFQVNLLSPGTNRGSGDVHLGS